MTTLRFGSSCAEDGSRRCTVQRHDRRGGGAVGSRRWEPMEAGGGSRRTGPRGRAERADFDGSEGEMKMG
jgi:hypothetical protein